MNKILYLLLIALAGTTLFLFQSDSVSNFEEKNHPLREEWKNWKVKFGKKYASMDVEAYRFRVFVRTAKKVEELNNEPDQTAKFGLTKFADLTDEEFKTTYLGLRVKQQVDDVVEEEVNASYPDINWTDKGAVTPIKNQGQCGSCWSFSTTGGLEGISFIDAGELQSFSEQQLVDCSTSYGNDGCNGGLMDYAYEYVQAQGIVHESQYPYTAVQGKCQINTGPFKCSGHTDVPQGSCASLSAAVQNQPISIGVDAATWSSYESGVLSKCGKQLDHGVLLTGLYTDTAVSQQVWIVKNSWGADWGMNGYIWLASGNTCGICNTASYPQY